MDDTDRSMLDLESRFVERAGLAAHRTRIAELAQTTYYQRLVRLVDDPQAAAEYPQLTARLRQLMAGTTAEQTRQAS